MHLSEEEAIKLIYSSSYTKSWVSYGKRLSPSSLFTAESKVLGTGYVLSKCVELNRNCVLLFKQKALRNYNLSEKP